ncbi:MAG: PAC2 family protein [Actinomycetota bacterium]|nr:PAC2 family protein [Actinomycetota bacterium]
MIELGDLPELRRPIVVAAFEGWNDAGEAASGAIEQLAREWDAQPVAALDPEDYYDFQVNRPTVELGSDNQRRIIWPTTRLLVAHRPGLDHDIVMVDGIEPSMRWRAFVVELLSFAQDVGAEMLVSVGALLADVPHTRPIPITATSHDPGLMSRLGLEPSHYEGPTGIVGVLADAAGQAGLPALSLWAAVPHYAGGVPSPKATLALLRRLEELLDVTVPLGDLPEEALAWERGVDELAENDGEVADYVKSLEQAKDTADLPEASGEAIAREFERYLQRRRDDEPPRAQG